MATIPLLDVTHRRKMYSVSSWHLNESESEEMWKSYAGSVEGVALQTRYAKLDASLPPPSSIADSLLFIGLVCYDDRDIQPLDSLLHRGPQGSAESHHYSLHARGPIGWFA
jgi:hypothetical protein